MEYKISDAVIRENGIRIVGDRNKIYGTNCDVNGSYNEIYGECTNVYGLNNKNFSKTSYASGCGNVGFSASCPHRKVLNSEYTVLSGSENAEEKREIEKMLDVIRKNQEAHSQLKAVQEYQKKKMDELVNKQKLELTSFINLRYTQLVEEESKRQQEDQDVASKLIEQALKHAEFLKNEEKTKTEDEKAKFLQQMMQFMNTQQLRKNPEEFEPSKSSENGMNVETPK